MLSAQGNGARAVMHRAYEATHAPVRVYWYDDRIEISNPGGRSAS
jgi:ATP-dependent DNA helicase RecG